ncbi:Ost3p [Sugiyamaella lignohabitans]|uniref:Ost3p n=1 Tax=Sugiyamaella lignohabitans TaxID=796027 RepID=A0A167EL43_9ASCO|nr:Ost3p [Sugiyamaella lignohabitans]ANB14202.1 Ost3p [Sugiyamaella lignohabitans]
MTRLNFVALLLSLVSIVLAVDTQYDAKYVNSLKDSSGIVRLTDATFSRVVEGPRDYTVAVLLTADSPKYGCQFCKIVGPPFETIASSWKQDHPNGDGLFFAVADIADTQGSFMQLGLTHAPNLYIYPPTEKPSTVDVGFDHYQFVPNESQVKLITEYLTRTYGFKIVIHEPFAWDRLFITIGGIVLVLGILKFASGVILSILQKKQLWIAVSLVAILMFTSGHMFNQIRKTPYIAGDGRGGVIYFVGGHSNQVAIETQFIAVTYAILAFATISLIVKVPRIENPQVQMFSVSCLSVVIILAFSFLLSKFQVKNGGYPFGILDIF